MFGGGGGSSPTYLLEMVQKKDVVCDRCLGDKYCFLFFDGGGKTSRRIGKVERVEDLIYFLVACFIGWVVFEMILPVV